VQAPSMPIDVGKALLWAVPANLKFYPPVYMEGPFRFGDYELASKLGEGGMGQVFKAYKLKEVGGKQVRMPTPYALKVPSSQLLQSDTIAAQMLAEAVAASRVHHANVVSLLDVGEVHGIPFLVMDFLEGKGLDEVLKAGPLPPGKILDAALAIANGLSAIHAAGLVHRDLKPSNVFVSSNGGYKLLDLGIAKAVDAQTRLTGTGMSKGTPGYMAPEQLVAGEHLDAKSDLFSLGALVAELALGKPVFYGETLIQLLMLMPVAEAHLASERIGPRVNHVQPGLGDLVMRCMRTDANQRPGADEVAGLLRQLGTAPPNLEPPQPPGPPRPKPKPPPAKPKVVEATRPVQQSKKKRPKKVAPTAEKQTRPVRRPPPNEKTAPPEAPPSKPDVEEDDDLDWRPKRSMVSRVAMGVAGLASFAVVAVGAVGIAFLVWPSGPPGVTIYHGLKDTPIDVRIDGQTGDTTESLPGWLFFDDVPLGTSKLAWAAGEGCLVATCPGSECPVWCEYRERDIEVTSDKQLEKVNPILVGVVFVKTPQLSGRAPVTAVLGGIEGRHGGDGISFSPVPFGPHDLHITVGECSTSDAGCWPNGTCARGCTSFQGQLVVPAEGWFETTLRIPDP